MTLYAIKDILPNPFRDMRRYPISREKVDQLKMSFAKTGFWENVVARAVGKKAELAYGHHRLVALQEEFGSDHQVELIIKPVTDEQMLIIMADENMSEWNANVTVEMETVRATVQAFADGKIKLAAVDTKTNQKHVRYAPSFVSGSFPGSDPEHAYTIRSLADFLGWTEPSGREKKSLRIAVDALEMIESGKLVEADFEGLTTSQAAKLLDEKRGAGVAQVTMINAVARQDDSEANEVQAVLTSEETASTVIKATLLPHMEPNAAETEPVAQSMAQELKHEIDEPMADVHDHAQGTKEERQPHVTPGTSEPHTRDAAAAEPAAGEKTTTDASVDPLKAVLATESSSGPSVLPISLEKAVEICAEELAKFLDPVHDLRGRQLEEVVRRRGSLPLQQAEVVAAALDSVAIRAADFAKRLREPANRDVGEEPAVADKPVGPSQREPAPAIQAPTKGKVAAPVTNKSPSTASANAGARQPSASTPATSTKLPAATTRGRNTGRTNKLRVHANGAHQ